MSLAPMPVRLSNPRRRLLVSGASRKLTRSGRAVAALSWPCGTPLESGAGQSVPKAAPVPLHWPAQPLNRQLGQTCSQ